MKWKFVANILRRVAFIYLSTIRSSDLFADFFGYTCKIYHRRKIPMYVCNYCNAKLWLGEFDLLCIAIMDTVYRCAN